MCELYSFTPRFPQAEAPINPRSNAQGPRLCVRIPAPGAGGDAGRRGLRARGPPPPPAPFPPFSPPGSASSRRSAARACHVGACRRSRLPQWSCRLTLRVGGGCWPTPAASLAALTALSCVPPSVACSITPMTGWVRPWEGRVGCVVCVCTGGSGEGRGARRQAPFSGVSRHGRVSAGVCAGVHTPARAPAGKSPPGASPADGSRVPLRGVSPLMRVCFIKASTRRK